MHLTKVRLSDMSKDAEGSGKDPLLTYSQYQGFAWARPNTPRGKRGR